VSSKHYPVPKVQKEIFRKELHRLVDIGVLNPAVQQSERGTPVLIIPKRDNTVQLLTDYHKVNKLIKRNPYQYASGIGRITVCISTGSEYEILYNSADSGSQRSDYNCHQIWQIQI
jgi:hypothetical protein